MKSFEIKEVLEKYFVFFKQLPNHIYGEGRNTQSFIVSQCHARTFHALTNEVGPAGKVESHKGVYKIIIGEKTYILLNGGSKPAFAYYVKYAYLGSILNTVLRNSLSPDLTINTEGLFITKYAQIENKNHLIIERLVTDNFFEILELFKLPIETFYSGFKNKLEFFRYLNHSPYIHSTSLVNYKDCENDFLKEFYNHCVQHDKLPHPPVFDKEKSYKYFNSYQHDKFLIDFDSRLKYNTEILSKLNFEKIVKSISDVIPEKSDIGKVLGLFKYSFASKHDFQSYIYSSKEEDVLAKIREFATESIS